MTFVLFSALDFGIGLGMFVLGLLGLYHLGKGYRFSEEQERTVISQLSWSLVLLGFSRAFGGVLGTLIDVSELETAIPVIAIIPLITRIVGGFILWWLIRWIVWEFYPTQEQ